MVAQDLDIALAELDIGGGAGRACWRSNGSPRARAMSPAVPGRTCISPTAPAGLTTEVRKFDSWSAWAKTSDWIDPPAAGRPPVGARIAGGEVDAGAARRVVRQPILGRGEVEVGGEVEKGVVVAGAADPRLVADELVGELRLADLGQSERGADVGLAGDAAPLGVPVIVEAGRRRAPLMPSAVAAMQAVEGLLLAGGGAQMAPGPAPAGRTSCRPGRAQ